MLARLAVLVSLAGCISVGGGAAVNAALTDSPVRRFGGQVHIGSFTEIVHARVVGQLFHQRDLGALGNRSSSIGMWGARVTSLPHGRLPGFYLTGAWGENDEVGEPEGSSVLVGAGVSYSSIRPTSRMRAWTGVSLGVVFRRCRQELIDDGEPGYFLGLELGVTAGLDVLGPMFVPGDDGE
jgi:hypothetical protein